MYNFWPFLQLAMNEKNKFGTVFSLNAIIDCMNRPILLHTVTATVHGDFVRLLRDVRRRIYVD